MELLRRSRSWLLATALAILPRPADARDVPPAIENVEPAREGNLLTCRVVNVCLPGGRIVSSLESGLPSAIEMELELLDERDRLVVGNHVSFRIAFDLWEEVFRLEASGDEARFDDLALLEEYLTVMPRLPVATISEMDPNARHRIRVGLRLHPIAPEETEKLGDLVAGEGSTPGRKRASERLDGQEVSVGLGEVIRYFFRGARRSTPTHSETYSAWFVLQDLEEGGGP